MSTASRDTLLQVFQDKTNRTLKPVVDKIINHSTKGYGFHEPSYEHGFGQWGTPVSDDYRTMSWG